MDGVVIGVGLDGAVFEEAARRVVAPEAPDVEGPEVHARVAVEDPARHGLAGAAGSGDTGGETAGDQGADADLAQDRHAFGGGQDDLLETLEVAGEELAGEVPRCAAPPAALGPLFPATDREGPKLGFQVEGRVGIAKGRQSGVVLDGLFGDHVLVFDDARRQPHAGHLAHRLGPEAGAVDHDLAVDRPLIGLHRGNPAAMPLEPGDAHALFYGDPFGPCALGIGLGETIGIDVAVRRDVGGAHDARRRHVGETLLGFAGRDQLGLETEAAGLGHGTLDFAQPRLGGGDAQRADLFPADVLAGLLGEAVVKPHRARRARW
jgi:hypothetical protein